VHHVAAINAPSERYRCGCGRQKLRYARDWCVASRQGDGKDNIVTRGILCDCQGPICSEDDGYRNGLSLLCPRSQIQDAFISLCRPRLVGIWRAARLGIGGDSAG
jgi:hypothetical protein